MSDQPLLKNYKFPKSSRKCYSKCFIIENNEVYNVLFILSYIIIILIRYFDL